MTITADQAKELLDKLKKDGYPGPFYFQPWGEQNQNGDYAESILFDDNGETLVYGLPDAVGDLATAAPDLARTIIDQAEEIEELRSTVAKFINKRPEYVTALENSPEPDADYMRWQGHADARRVIDRPEDLDALPVGSIVIDGDDDPWKKTRSGEWILGEDYQTSDELLRYIATSLRVIYVPEVTA